MENKGTFTITLADGTQLTGLELNGNNFISKTQVTPETFAGKLKKVTISGETTPETADIIGEHTNMELVQILPYEGAWWFVLRDLTEQEVRNLRIDARLDYIEMMEDIA